MVSRQQERSIEPVTVYWEEGDLHLVRGERTGTEFYRLGSNGSRTSLETVRGRAVSVLIERLGEIVPRSELKRKVGIDSDRRVVNELDIQFAGSRDWKIYATQGSVNGVIGIVPKSYQPERQQ